MLGKLDTWLTEHPKRKDFVSRRRLLHFVAVTFAL